MVARNNLVPPIGRRGDIVERDRCLRRTAEVREASALIAVMVVVANSAVGQCSVFRLGMVRRCVVMLALGLAGSMLKA